MSLLDRDHLIALSLLPFLTPARTRLLRVHFDPLTDVRNVPLRVIEGLLSIDGEQAALVKHPLASERTRQQVAALRASVITLVDDDYPKLLREIVDPPLVLHCRGNRALLHEPSVAVVGSRRATPYASNAAEHLTRELVAAGLTIVSGFARGIDAAAHESTLEARGHTIAVLGNGIDVIYPRFHARLFRRIEAEGLLVSEFPPGTPPRKANFPMRNRVISGLTSGTMIVEATSRSGSLITARTAAEQGREVFAVPGSIFSPGSEGTHRLIQYGAKLVHDVHDVLHELRVPLPPRDAPPPEPESPLREVLHAFTREEGTHVDAVAARLGRGIAELSEPLLQLELGGWLRALPGGRYVRAR